MPIESPVNEEFNSLYFRNLLLFNFSMQLIFWDKTIVSKGKYNFYTFLFIFVEKIANMKYILPVVFLLMSATGFTQTSQQFQVRKSGVVDFKANNNRWYASVQNMEMPSPEGNSDKAKLLRLKREFGGKIS